MTHEEFVEKLNRFFSMNQIEALENFGHDSAREVHEGAEEITNDDDLLWFMGRDFAYTFLWDCMEVEEVNAVLPDNDQMTQESFMNMVDVQNACGFDEW